MMEEKINIVDALKNRRYLSMSEEPGFQQDQMELEIVQETCIMAVNVFLGDQFEDWFAAALHTHVYTLSFPFLCSSFIPHISIICLIYHSRDLLLDLFRFTCPSIIILRSPSWFIK